MNQTTTVITYAGPADPFRPGLLGDQEISGPVLSCLQAGSFDRLLLLALPAWTQQAEDTLSALQSARPGLNVSMDTLTHPDLVDVSATFEALRLRLVHELARNGNTRLVLAVHPACPELHAAGLALGVTGEIPFTLITGEGPRYAGDPGGCFRETSFGADVEHTGGRMVHDPGTAYTINTTSGQRSPGGGKKNGSPVDVEVDVYRAAKQLGLHGTHPGLLSALDTAAAVAPYSVPVLIQGETGTGKGLMARLVHHLSGRDENAFVAVNCSALPQNLVESILFGHKKGAFTGATEDQPGKFVLADGGTLFLDEIGELPLELQPKLLKILEDGVVEPLGAKKGRHVDVRIITATNRNLKEEVREKRFREDLYYRLSYGVMVLPPLRERRSDIRHLALNLLDRLNNTLKTPKTLSPEALVRLETLPWEGNIRGLENVLGRSVLMSTSDMLHAEDLVLDDPCDPDNPLDALPVPAEGFSLEDYLAAVRKQLILRALDIEEGNQTGAAKRLGISPQAVHKFVRSQNQAS